MRLGGENLVEEKLKGLMKAVFFPRLSLIQIFTICWVPTNTTYTCSTISVAGYGPIPSTRNYTTAETLRNLSESIPGTHPRSCRRRPFQKILDLKAIYSDGCTQVYSGPMYVRTGTLYLSVGSIEITHTFKIAIYRLLTKSKYQVDINISHSSCIPWVDLARVSR